MCCMLDKSIPQQDLIVHIQVAIDIVPYLLFNLYY